MIAEYRNLFSEYWKSFHGVHSSGCGGLNFLGSNNSQIYPHMRAKFGYDPTVM